MFASNTDWFHQNKTHDPKHEPSSSVNLILTLGEIHLQLLSFHLSLKTKESALGLRVLISVTFCSNIKHHMEFSASKLQSSYVTKAFSLEQAWPFLKNIKILVKNHHYTDTIFPIERNK